MKTLARDFEFHDPEKYIRKNNGARDEKPTRRRYLMFHGGFSCAGDTTRRDRTRRIVKDAIKRKNS